jgi:hypothetical protein
MGRAERRAAEKTAKTELKKLQNLPVDRFAGWLGHYQQAAYQDGFEDGIESNTMAIMRYLHDDFGFGDKRFQRLIECAKKDVKAMREGDITPKEFKDGLAAEGCNCLKQLQMKGEPDPLREWVPVETTLPPEEERVLCCTQNKKGAKNLIIGYYMDGMWRVGMNSNVIAWRMLPPAYEEDKK